MSTDTPQQYDMDKIISLSKRRGFLFQSSEIYGGLNATWDYGPLGVELKRNVKEAWWRSMVLARDDTVGLDAAILMHPRTWEASGHLDNFSDPLTECKACHQRFRSDDLRSGASVETSKQQDDLVQTCPNCGGMLTDPRNFNLMFKTFMGPVEDTASQVYLRPETAQGIFVNFANVLNTSRRKLPFGIAQVGKAFRNEITPGNSTFRTREFEQMEMEFFVKPGNDDEWMDYWVSERFNWYIRHGMNEKNLRLRQHDSNELAHYAKSTFDIEYNFPWGWAELEGIANRTDFDLRRHSEYSGQDLTYFDSETKERYYPYVIEPSGGLDRASLAFLVDAYEEETMSSPKLAEQTDSSPKEQRLVLRFHHRIAPVTVAILPLSRNDKLTPTAKEVHAILRGHFSSVYDDAQSIGRRYRRQDEVGTPYCVTVDFDTLNDRQVTLRDRDTMRQLRLPISNLVATLRDKLEDTC